MRPTPGGCKPRGPLALLLLATLAAAVQGTAATYTYSFLGCFADMKSRAISTLISTNAAMTTQMCARLASQNGYTIFGLQDGTQCFGAGGSSQLDTANAFADAQQYGPTVDVYGGSTPGKPASNGKAAFKDSNMAECTQPCGGDKSSTCGGAWANQVYHLAYSYYPMGCYADNSARMLPYQVDMAQQCNNKGKNCVTISNLPNCAIAAKAKGCTVFGLQDGGQCWCGTSTAQATSLGRSSSCNMLCYGPNQYIDEGEMEISVTAAYTYCGGAWANQVYQFYTPQASTATVAPMWMPPTATWTDFVPAPLPPASWGSLSKDMSAAAVWNATAAREGGEAFSTASQCAGGVAVTTISAWYTEELYHSTWDYQQGTQGANDFYSYTPAGIETIAFVFNDGSTQVVGNSAVQGAASQTMTLAADETVVGLQVLSSQVFMSPNHVGFPSFGGFIVTTSSGSAVTFSPGNAESTTTVQEYGTAYATPNVEYLGSGYLCGMYGWTMGTWEILTSIDTVGQYAGSASHDTASDIQRTYGLRDLDYSFEGGSWYVGGVGNPAPAWKALRWSTTRYRACIATALCRWQNQGGKGANCASGSTNCISALKKTGPLAGGTSKFIAAAGFLFLNQLQSSEVSNFVYSFPEASPPTLQFVSTEPAIQDVDDSGKPMIMQIDIATWRGSTTSISDSSGTEMSQGSTMGNSYSKTQSLSFSPPKIHATIGMSGTKGGDQTQSWGYSSDQQTSWVQTTNVASISAYKTTYPLVYGNVLYNVAEQYYGSLSSVPFVGSNTLTFTPCTTPLCTAAGVSSSVYPVVNQTVLGTFTGQFYTASAITTMFCNSTAMYCEGTTNTCKTSTSKCNCQTAVVGCTMECFNCETVSGSFCPPSNNGCGPDLTPSDVVSASEEAIPNAGRRLQAVAKKPSKKSSNTLHQFVVDGKGRTIAAMAMVMNARAKCLKAANPQVKDEFTKVAGRTGKIRVPVKCLNFPPPLQNGVKARAADFGHPPFERKSAPRRPLKSRLANAPPPPPTPAACKDIKDSKAAIACCKRTRYNADKWCATRYPALEEAKLPATGSKKPRSPPAPPMPPRPPGPCRTSNDSFACCKLKPLGSDMWCFKRYPMLVDAQAEQLRKASAKKGK